MAAAPPSSLSYRTTGSTCLHPLSQLLGIPLDQVSAAGAQDTLPEPMRVWSLLGKCYLSPSIPAPIADLTQLQTTQVGFFF